MGMNVPGLAKMMGVQGQTVRLWIKQGKIPYHVNPSGRAYFTDDDLEKIIKKPTPQSWCHYARSSCGSTTAINNQLTRLAEEYGTPKYSITDRASGLNEKRHGLQQILAHARNGEITDLAITTTDRLTRFGYTYLETYLTEHGVTIHVLEGTTEKQPEAELIDDFMALLASFSGRYYHLRSAKNQQRFLEQAQAKAATATNANTNQS